MGIFKTKGSVQFNEICLTRKELKYLRTLRDSKIAVESGNHDDFQRLKRLELIDELLTQVEPGSMPITTGYFLITHKGIDFLIYRKSALLNKWIPYIITTVIALAGFANSMLLRFGI
jgi:DNA repair exonuclease SbcCD nuclease subunit